MKEYKILEIEAEDSIIYYNIDCDDKGWTTSFAVDLIHDYFYSQVELRKIKLEKIKQL